MNKYVIGIDNGGTYIKAVLYNNQGEQIAIEKEPSIATVLQAEWVELDQDDLWNANCRCVRKVIKNSGISQDDILGIGIAGQGKGLYSVDTNGESVRKAITSADGRSWKYVQKWKEDGTADKIFKYTYQGLFASHPVSILAWLKDNEPDNYRKIRWIFSMKDYLVFKMTGKAVSDFCNQSGGSFVNLNTGKYEPEILKALGIPEVEGKLPQMMHSAEVCGTVTRKAALELGCGENTKVVTGMFDVDASAIAMGVVSEETLCMITGTCSENAYISKNPVTDGSILMNSYYCIPGYYLIEEGSNTSAGVLEWVIKTFYSREKQEILERGNDFYEYLDSIVDELKPTESDVLFLPFLYGSAGNSKSKGVWLGMSPLDTKEHMLRAVYEGVVFSHKWHMDRLLKNRPAAKLIRMAGGATNSDVWIQMFSNILQTPIEVAEGRELGARGAAIAAEIGVGIYKDFFEASNKTCKIKKTVYPSKEWKEIYEKKYQRYFSVVENLQDVWKLF